MSSQYPTIAFRAMHPTNKMQRPASNRYRKHQLNVYNMVIMCNAWAIAKACSRPVRRSPLHYPPSRCLMPRSHDSYFFHVNQAELYTTSANQRFSHTQSVHTKPVLMCHKHTYITHTYTQHNTDSHTHTHTDTTTYGIRIVVGRESARGSLWPSPDAVICLFSLKELNLTFF